MSEKTEGVASFDVAGCSGHCYGGYRMEEDRDGWGEYVKAEDYRSLQARIAENAMPDDYILMADRIAELERQLIEGLAREERLRETVRKQSMDHKRAAMNQEQNLIKRHIQILKSGNNPEILKILSGRLEALNNQVKPATESKEFEDDSLVMTLLIMGDKISDFMGEISQLKGKVAGARDILCKVRDSFIYVDDHSDSAVMSEAENHYFEEICNFIKFLSCDDTALRQMIEAAKAEEREKAVALCNAEADRMEQEAQQAIQNGEHDEVSSIRSAAWKLSVVANRIKGQA